MGLELSEKSKPWKPIEAVKPEIEKSRVFSTTLGALYEGNCLDLLPFLRDEAIDTVFADPPFNLSKEYGSRVNDDLSDAEFLV